MAPASLSILTSTFTDPTERNRAVGLWGAMGGAGGGAGVLLGGVLTDTLELALDPLHQPADWPRRRLPAAAACSRAACENATRNFDIPGALTATVGLSALVFGIVRTDSSGWGDPTTLISIGAGLSLLGVYRAARAGSRRRR